MITSSLVWNQALEEIIAFYHLERRPSLSDMMRLYPVEHDLKLQQNPKTDTSYEASKINWSRLRNGSIRVMESSCTKRIEKDHPSLRSIRQHPVWILLGKSNLSLSKIKKIICQLDPILKNKLYTHSDCKLGIKYKRLYWSDTHIELIESIDALAFKIALYRLSKLTTLDSKWPVKLDELALSFLRLICRNPWQRVSDRLVRLFWVLASNEGKEEEIDFEKILISENIDRLYQRILQLSLDSSNISWGGPSTLKGYIQMNKNLVQNFWDACHQGALETKPRYDFSLKTLYWADTHVDSWLNQGHSKELLFNRESPLFKEQFRHYLFGSRRQIW